jgi:hypothetical protein
MAMNGVGAFFDGFNQAYDTVGRVSRDAELAKIAKAGVKPLPGQTPEQLRAGDLRAEADNDPSVGAAVQPQKFEFLGKQYDVAPDEPTMTRDRQLAMAGVYEKHGEVAQGMGMRREVRRDQLADEEAKLAPLRRRSLELGVQREEQAAQDDAARRQADAASKDWWDKRLTSNDGTKRSADPKDFTDFSQQRVYDLVQSGRMADAAKAYLDHTQQAFVQIQLQTAGRKNDGEQALQALYQGNTDGVLGWYNKYAPDGATATGIKFNKDGSVAVERKGSDGKKVDPVVFKGGTAEMAASIRQAFDPDAMYQWSQGEFQKNLQLRQDARAGAASGRAAQEFAAGEPARKLAQTMAKLQTELIDPNTTPARRTEVQTLLASAKGPDKDAPAQVKLAEAFVRAGLKPDMKSALEFAMTSKDKSPEALKADIYKAALTANMGDAKRAQQTTEAAMSYLADGAAPAGTPAPGATTRASFASAAEAEAAAKAGKIKPGDRISIGGQAGTWR